ncbi:DUF2284 domain-containing protein [Labilibacter marinus]|uniref:DUF2284 domain-containing protein n=1 Tax=Labilibacter marinus TaxID=1477105 RepID=UPI000833223B|nr:DUF2284 domain-containing protein [Labilibacter marinus]
MESIAHLDEIIKDQGFIDYKWINTKDIEVAHWVRVKCQFGCSDFGLGTCPPNTPDVEDCRKFFNEYKKAIVIRLNKKADRNNYPSDWSKEMTNNLLKLEREIFLANYPKVFLLNQTCCSICKDCSSNRLQCKDKKNSRPSPESFSVDVYSTLKNVGMEIQVVSENPGEMNRIAILLVS